MLQILYADWSGLPPLISAQSAVEIWVVD